MKTLWPTGIRGRLTAVILLAVAPIFLLGVGVAVFFVLQEARNARLMTLQEKPNHIAAQLEHSWSGVCSDAVFLTSTSPIEGMLRAWANHGVDPVAGRTEGFWCGRMAEVFAVMVETKPIYDQIRLLDRDGMEVVRVNAKAGRAVLAPDDQLQNKRDRYYFTTTAKLAKGQCYVSPPDLNQEHGQIEIPHQPTVRVATPVFDVAGRFQGIVIVNVRFAEILNVAVAEHRTTGVELFVADEAGYYLYHTGSPAKAWGGPRDLDTGENVKNDYPAHWKTILSGNEHVLKTRDGHVLIQVSRPWPDPGRFLVVGALVPDAVLRQSGAWPRLAAVILISLSLLVVILAAVVRPVEQSIIQPVTDLLHAVERFRSGERQARAPVGRATEIGRLARAFNEMAQTIATEQERLTAEVHSRTAQVEESRHAALNLLRDANLERQRAVAAAAKLAASEKALQLRVNWVQGLQQAGEELAACKTVEDVVCVIARAPVTHLGARMAWVGVPGENGRLTPLTCGSPDSQPDAETCACAELVYATGRKKIVPDTRGQAPSASCQSLAEARGYRSCGTWPIQAGDGKCLGTLTIRCPEKGEESRVVVAGTLIDVFCRQVGYAWERLLREDRLRLLTRAMEQSPASVVITDTDGKIVYVNPKFEGLTGYSAAEALGKNPRILNARVQPPAVFAEMWRALRAGEEWHGEICNRKKNGEIFWEWASISAVRDSGGKIVHFVAVKEDITKRKQVAEELAQAKDAAEAASRAKSDFLANMSHELRTPLGAITGFSELLQEKLFGDLNAKQEEYVTDILESGRHLLSLINDILDLAKVEAGKMELAVTRFPVAPLLDGSLMMVKEKCLKHGIALSLDLPEAVGGLVISADERNLKQVLFNLLSNAAKFTPDGGAITVSARLVTACGSEGMGAGGSGPAAIPGPPAALEISIADTGIGIAKENQEKVFEEFYQVSGTAAAKTPGTGLGLSLVRRLVGLHGGRVWVESQGEGRGSTFRFTLPLQQG